MLKTVLELVAEASTDLRCLTAQSAFMECEETRGHIIDVRESAEVDLHPVPGSLNIPRGVLEMKIGELTPDPASPLYIHCASSARARLAAAQLKHMGYTNVSVISCNIEQICQACVN